MKNNLSKKILVMGPALPCWLEISSIAKTLEFLSVYKVDFVDPLRDLTSKTNAFSFLAAWKNKIETYADNYDAFFGFSLGGVILQQCFEIFEKKRKPLVFFSVPTFADELLTARLSKVIQLIHKASIEVAVNELNQYVFYPDKPPLQMPRLEDVSLASQRLSFGLNFVLNVDSRAILKNIKFNYLHLIGEESQLVNCNNVICSSNTTLVIVPKAGMRMLQNNPASCQQPIIEYLNRNLS